MLLSAGNKLGPYEILSNIGAGGMGEVYKARDTRLDRIVALKVSKQEFNERFEREARAIAALNHSNICQLYDVGPNYLVMEFIEGSPLRGPLPVEKAVEYATQLLDALDAAHKKGFTHRDLKPANILITKQGTKLLDFGLAKLSAAAPLKETDATRTGALTAQGTILGTLQYMSPEQLDGKPVDARSDLFAFGCVLYEMLSGKRAFDGDSAASVIAAVMHQEPAPLDLHPPLGRVIARCLAKDPEKRFQTALDLKCAIAWAVDRQPDDAPPAPPHPPRLWWIATAAALVLGAAGQWAISRSAVVETQTEPIRLQVAPPEGGTFSPSDIAVSPDGRTLAFVVILGGKRELWVRPMNGTAARVLAGTVGATQPFWSPDSRSIAYQSGRSLQRIDVAGGAPIAICECGQYRGGAWSEDGSILLGSITDGLLRVPASGGKPVSMTTLDASTGEISHRWPQLIPGGRFIYFGSHAEKEETSNVYVAALASPNQRTRLLGGVSSAQYAAGHLLWLRGSTLVAQRFDADRLHLSGEPQAVAQPVAGGFRPGEMSLSASLTNILLYAPTGPRSQFAWLDRSGNSLGAWGEPDQYQNFRLSPTADRIVAARRHRGGSDVWMMGQEGIWSRLTFLPGTNNTPVWAPDESSIVFSSIGRASYLFRKEASGAGAEQRIAESKKIQSAMDWSRNGRWLLYTEGVGAEADVWFMPMNASEVQQEGAKATPYLNSPGRQGNARFSPEPEPRWVVYTSDDAGRPEIYVQGFPKSRGKWQISAGGGDCPSWSADGREIFYVSPESKLIAVNVKVDAGSVARSAPRELFTVGRSAYELCSYEAAPDGQRFLVLTQRHTPQPLEVVVNWPALLNQKASNE